MWAEFQDEIREFLDRRPDYEQLCSEVRYALEKSLSKAGIEFSSVTARAKSLESFVDKVQRKGYDLPFEQVTDLAGARIVCLYVSDLEHIESLLRREFDVIKKTDKRVEQQPDQFGYVAVHYLVRLGSSFSGARYDDLRDHVCEIQVRTVLQDAWAVMNHHLAYKSRAATPPKVERTLSRLAAQLEGADEEFQRARDEREQYVAEVSALSGQSDDQFLSTETNVDSVKQYLEWKFPGVPIEARPNQFSLIFDRIDLATYPTLRDLDALVTAESVRIAGVLKDAGEVFTKVDDSIPAVMHLGLALGFSNPALLAGYNRRIIQAVKAAR